MLRFETAPPLIDYKFCQSAESTCSLRATFSSSGSSAAAASLYEYSGTVLVRVLVHVTTPRAGKLFMFVVWFQPNFKRNKDYGLSRLFTLCTAHWVCLGSAVAVHMYIMV